MLRKLDFGRPRVLTLANVPDGMEGLVAADLARASARARRGRAGPDLQSGPDLVVVARDGTRMAGLEEALGFFAPDIEVLTFPAWDCQPNDRV